MAQANVVTIEPWDCEIVGEEPPRLPDGEYVVRFLGHDTAIAFKTGKVFLRFSIVDPGPLAETNLYKPYRARELCGRPGPNGKFTLSRGSDLYKDIARLQELARRPDRISLQFLKGRLWRIRTRTVTKDHRQKDLPEALKYTVIDEILRAETG